MPQLNWRESVPTYAFIFIAYAAWIGAHHFNKADARVPPPKDVAAKPWTPEKFGHIQCKSLKITNDDSPFEIELTPYATGAWIVIEHKGEDRSCLCLSIAENGGPDNPYKIVATLIPDNVDPAAPLNELTLEAGGAAPAKIILGDDKGTETVTAVDYRPLPSYTAAELLQRLGEAAAYAVDALLLYIGVGDRVPEAA